MVCEYCQFLVAGHVPPGENKRKLIYESCLHIWDPPYLFRVCADGLLRRCVPVEEGIKLFKSATHHHMEDIMGHSVLMRRFDRVDSFGQPCMKITRNFIWRCGVCQRHRNINSRDAMPLTNNLQIELFDVWGIDYMGPFPKSKN
jgi:hypothetical protein